jgi:CRISPR-associated protein (TIGR03984 family)
MINENSVNGLELSEINSDVVQIEAISDLNEINSYIKIDSKVIAYLDQRVLVGRYSNSTFSFYDGQKLEKEFIQRLRIFNRDEEFMIWRSGGTLKGRYRKDNTGNKKSWVVDNDQVLFGTKAYEFEGYIKLTEDRGTEIILPFTNLSIDDKKNRMKIKTRNYIGYSESHLATYIDSRFIEFTFGEKNKSLEV